MIDVSEPEEASAVSTEPVQHPALVAFQDRTRRGMRIYAAVLVGLVVLAFVAVKLAYAHGELNKVSASTGTVPTPIQARTTGSALSLAWQSDDRPAGGNPFSDGIVVSYDAHTVNGRDALTGAVRWHYTRSDETVCSVLQQDSSTIAIYRRKGNCDEVTGFVTATGVAKWYRTLMDDGKTSTASTSNVVLTVADQSVHEFDNAGGLDRWNWTPPASCTVSRALVGTIGALISLDCGATHRLVLRDLFNDKDKWTVNTASAMVPLAASAFVGALDPATGAVHSYAADKGTDSVTDRLPGAVVSDLPRAATSIDYLNGSGLTVEFNWVGKLISLSNKGKVNWTAAATSAPWLVGTTLIAAADGAGRVVSYRAGSGQPQLTSTLSPAPAATERPYPIGAGLLMAGNRLAYYR
jgi:hypothetical protein